MEIGRVDCTTTMIESGGDAVGRYPPLPATGVEVMCKEYGPCMGDGRVTSLYTDVCEI